jgi:TatD DNase family protein
MQYIDVHSHLNHIDGSSIADEQEAIMLRMRQEGITTITVGVDFETSREAVELAEKNPDILWATVGLHPTDNLSEAFDYDAYLNLAKHEKMVAIGECGLDYYRSQDGDTKEKQKTLFLEHIKLAQAVDKPLMIHARPSKGTMDAYEDVLDILESIENPPRANFHFFVGNVPIASRILKLGGTMSFDGPITFTKDYDEVIQYIPLESLHAETDAPFAAPVPYRGQTNYPYYVPHIVERIAIIKNLPIEQVRVQLLENAEKFFGISMKR